MSKEQFDVTLPPYFAIPVELRGFSQVVDWGHRYLRASEVYGKTKGEKAIIFILDTAGVFDHPDLKDNALNELAKNFTDSPTMTDIHGHGTHCAGIAAATDNSDGVIGVAPAAKLVPMKVLNDGGSASYTWIIDGVYHVADLKLPKGYENHRKIISMSLGGPSGSPNMEKAIDYAISKGVFVIAAAGNSGYKEGQNTIGYPGRYEQVITVASIGKSGEPSGFSSNGAEVDLAAPGEGVYSTHKNNGYAYLSGTSMACPHVSGVAALVLSYFPHIKNQFELEAFLEDFAKDIYDKGEDDRTGAGVPDLPLYFEQTPEDPGNEDPGDEDPVPETVVLDCVTTFHFAHRVHTEGEESIYSRLHGHTAKVSATLTAPNNGRYDMLYHFVNNWFGYRVALLDHKTLIGKQDQELLGKGLPGAYTLQADVADLPGIAKELVQLVSVNFGVIELTVDTGREKITI